MNGSRRPVCSALGAAFLLALGACGGSEFGEEIRVPVERQHVIRPAASAGSAALALPEDQPFAIHFKRSSQNPGGEGQAQGESDARSDGTAFCSVIAANGGTAGAEFNLGHRVENRSELAQEVTIDCAFELKQELRATTPPSPRTKASAALTLIVLDARRHVLGRVQLVQADSDTGAGQARSSDQRSMAVKLDAGGTCDIMLFGKVDAGGAPSEEATARLEVEKLRMRLSMRGIQTQPAGG